MPYKKKFYKKKPKKRVYRKKTAVTSNGRAATFNKMFKSNYTNLGTAWTSIPFPSVIKHRASWVENKYEMATTGGGLQYTQLPLIRLNDALDPFMIAAVPPLTQESVRYHTIYSRYYEQYSINFAYIKVEVRMPLNNSGQAQGDDARVLMGIGDTVATSAISIPNVEEIEMFPGVQSRLIEASQGSKFNRQTLYFKFDVKKWWARNKIPNDARATPVGSSPAESPCLWALVAADTNNPFANVNVQFDFKGLFYTKYSVRDDEQLMTAQ